MKALSVRLAMFLILLSLDAAGARMAVPGITGGDDRVISDTRDRPWSAVGRLNITVGGFCTATVIGPRQVLTAAHCLWNKRTARWLPPCALHFLAGYQRGEYTVHALVSEIHIADGFRMFNMAALDRDWAIATLDRDVLKYTGVIELADGAAQPGDALIQAGYSRDRSHVLTVDRSCRFQRRWGGSNLFIHDCDATYGDSGSPVLVETEQGFRLVGIHTALRGSGQASQGIAVASSAFGEWLDANPVTQPLGGVKACAVDGGQERHPEIEKISASAGRQTPG